MPCSALQSSCTITILAKSSTTSAAIENFNESQTSVINMSRQGVSFTTKDGVTITRVGTRSFHSSTTTRPVAHTGASAPSPFLSPSDGVISQGRQPSTGRQGIPLSSPKTGREPVSRVTSSLLKVPPNIEVLASARQSPDKDLDRLATQLLEQLDLVSESMGGNVSKTAPAALNSTPPLSPKPESFVRLRADSTSHDEHTVLPGKKTFSSEKQHNSYQPSKATSRNFATYPPLETIYANIVDLTADDDTIQPKQAANESGLVKLLRRIKGLSGIRLAKDRPLIQLSKGEESLGSVLVPPQGSSHFDVQLTICGLLRRNAASPYELYHFFLENGFFAYLQHPPAYEAWTADYSAAVECASPFYSEGIRVGLDGDMDFLRTLFQQWCEAWHDWRLSRPLPGSEKSCTISKSAKWKAKMGR